MEKQIATIFYEVIAYFGSACLAFIVFSWGLLDLAFLTRLQQFAGSLTGSEQALLLLAAGTITYIYGQLASTLSSPIIASPIAAFSKRFPAFFSSDFRFNFGDIIDMYGFGKYLPEK